MTKTAFTQEWKDWISTNINNGQNKDGIFKILLDEGYDAIVIAKEMSYLPLVPFEQLENPFHANKEKNQNQSTISDKFHGKAFDPTKLFIPNAENLSCENLELYTVDNFLNKQECDKIIDLILSKLRPSELSHYESDSDFRTSSTCDLGTLNDSFMEDIDNRICRMIGIDSSYSEVVQGQYYEVGQQFKAHTDYFEPHEVNEYAGEMGQRTYTMMIYLNDVEEGGETAFVNIDKEFKPKQGKIIIWNSLDSDGTPNRNSMHFAKPVVKGYKAVITKWFRSYSNAEPSPPMSSREIGEFVPNYTDIGFKKTVLPDFLFQKINNFYHQNRNNKLDEHEPDFIMTSDNKGRSSILINLSNSLRAEIHECMKPMLEEWCGKELKPTYVYGIREYQNKAILKSHRDRIETHVISVIINVDQEVNEDWPLIIEDNYYRTNHVMLKPGEVVFYESARLKHGRPIPLNGESFANIFCHFAPVDYEPIQQ